MKKFLILTVLLCSCSNLGYVVKDVSTVPVSGAIAKAHADASKAEVDATADKDSKVVTDLKALQLQLKLAQQATQNLQKQNDDQANSYAKIGTQLNKANAGLVSKDKTILKLTVALIVLGAGLALSIYLNFRL